LNLKIAFGLIATFTIFFCQSLNVGDPSIFWCLLQFLYHP
jgi:hypothetical protein